MHPDEFTLQKDPEVLEAMRAARAHLIRASEAVETAFNILAEMSERTIAEHNQAVGVRVNWMVVRSEVLPIHDAVEVVKNFVQNGEAFVNGTIRRMEAGERPKVTTKDYRMDIRNHVEGESTPVDEE